MSKGYGPLADRPDRPVVGLAVSHESADLHVTGVALYTQDLVGRTLGTLHAWPVQAPHAHARVTGLRTAAAATTSRVHGLPASACSAASARIGVAATPPSPIKMDSTERSGLSLSA